MSSPKELFEQFSALLASGEKEQVYQSFLEDNPQLIPREFIQNHGIHLDLVLRKLGIGKDYVTDFFYLAKSSAKWHCVFIELERPSSKFFKDGTNDIHGDFQKGLDQIHRWKAWFSNNANRTGFLDGEISMLRVPLSQNPCELKYVLVSGRRAELEGNNVRRSVVTSYETDDFHILTYDSLLEALHSKRPLYVGARRNEYVEISSSSFAGEDLFAWIKPEMLRISAALKSDIEAHRDRWFHYSTDGTGMELMLNKKLPLVPVI